METTTLPGGTGRRPNLTTVTGLTPDQAEGQVTAGVHHAQHPALRQTLASQGQTLEMATRPAQPERPTLLPEHADALHAVAGAAFRQPPAHPMVFLDDGNHVTAAQIAAACSRAIAVAAPAGWGAPTVAPQLPDPHQAEILFGEVLDTALLRVPDIQPMDTTGAAGDQPPAADDPNKPDPIATLVGDVRARLSGATQVTLGAADLAHAKVGAEAAAEALRAKGLVVHEINPGVLLVTQKQEDPPGAAGDQPPAGGGTGSAGQRKEDTPPTQCPYCDADPFGSVKGRDMHIRNKHPDQPVPQHAAK